MRRLFVLFIILLLFAGCSQQQAEIPSGGSAGPTMSDGPFESASPLPSETRTETPEVTATIPPKPELVTFGYVKTVEDDGIVIVICDRIYHKADEIDNNGDPYGHDWTEIKAQDRTARLEITGNTKYLYADLFSQSSGSDDKIRLQSVGWETFKSVCTKSYYGSRLYFEFVYKGDKLSSAELYLSYYLNG